jgi:hypothetical protein
MGLPQCGQRGFDALADLHAIDEVAKSGDSTCPRA